MIPSKRTNPTLAKIKSGQIAHLYVMGNFASPRYVDFICQSGHFDALWFDLEHFDIPTQDLAVLNLVSRGYDLSTIARFKATDYQVVMRMLEAGTGGIMCSMVNSADEAREIVKWAKFNNSRPGPGEVIGDRGWNGGNIDSAYGNFPALDYMRHQNSQTMIICQIETEGAVAQANAIAAVPGVDGLFFGPGDFSAALGVVGDFSHDRVVSAMESVAQAARAHRKWWGTVAVGAEMYQRVKVLGAQLICPGGDVRTLNLGLRELIKTFAAPPPSAS